MGLLDLPEESRVIGGATYRVQPLTTRKSLQVMTRVLKMAGPGFGDVTSLAQAASAVGELLSGIAAHVDEDVILFVCEAFADVTKVEVGNGVMNLGKNSAGGYGYDEHFRGKPAELFAWVKFAGEVSFGPLVAAAKAAMPKPPEPPASPDAPGPAA